MIGFLVFVFGLVIGSFLNAVIYRIHARVSFLRGHSFCPGCRHDLHAADLIPVFSFLWQRGKCRYCHQPISWQYPLVETATALIFFMLYVQFGLSAQFFVYLVYAGFLIVLFVYDLRYYLIPDRVSLPGIIVAFILSYFILDIGIFSLMAGTLIGGGFFLLQYAVSRGRWIGGGDIRLGALMGMMLGWPQVVAALFIAYVTGSIVGIFLIVLRQKKWQSQVPFGTFLTGATVVTFFFGPQIIDFYRDLFLL